MPKPPRQKTLALADLRREIDRIDEAMHELLLERGEIIERLIAVKKTEETGSAFRPARDPLSRERRLVPFNRAGAPHPPYKLGDFIACKNAHLRKGDVGRCPLEGCVSDAAGPVQYLYFIP